MTHSVFIDGAAGTTGLEIADRLAGRAEFELIKLDDTRRKDAAARREVLNEADFAILCLPDGIWAWPIGAPQDITAESLERVFAAKGVELFMLGTGKQPWLMPEALRWRFRDARIGLEVTPTGPAVRTYNILFAEGRRVGAALIAVD